MMYREIMADFRNHMQHKNTLFRQNVEILMIDIMTQVWIYFWENKKMPLELSQ